MGRAPQCNRPDICVPMTVQHVRRRVSLDFFNSATYTRLRIAIGRDVAMSITTFMKPARPDWLAA